MGQRVTVIGHATPNDETSERSGNQRNANTRQNGTDEKIIQQLEERYPSENIDWQAALQRTSATGGKIYHHIFHIPLVWVVAYPDEGSVPDLAKYR